MNVWLTSAAKGLAPLIKRNLAPSRLGPYQVKIPNYQIGFNWTEQGLELLDIRYRYECTHFFTRGDYRSIVEQHNDVIAALLIACNERRLTVGCHEYQLQAKKPRRTPEAYAAFKENMRTLFGGSLYGGST